MCLCAHRYILNYYACSRLLPMGIVRDSSEEKCLGIVTGEPIVDVF